MFFIRVEWLKVSMYLSVFAHLVIRRFQRFGSYGIDGFCATFLRSVGIGYSGNITGLFRLYCQNLSRFTLSRTWIQPSNGRVTWHSMSNEMPSMSRLKPMNRPISQALLKGQPRMNIVASNSEVAPLNINQPQPCCGRISQAKPIPEKPSNMK